MGSSFISANEMPAWEVGLHQMGVPVTAEKLEIRRNEFAGRCTTDFCTHISTILGGQLLYNTPKWSTCP
jgi:hypothetical protein